MSVSLLKCLYAHTPPCCMDQFTKTTVKASDYEAELMDEPVEMVPENNTLKAQFFEDHDSLTIRNKFFQTQQIEQLETALEEQRLNHSNRQDQPPRYRMNGQGSNQAEYERARALFSRVQGDQQRPLVTEFSLEILKTKTTPAGSDKIEIHTNVEIRESVELPCIFGCFTMLKKLFCGR